MLLPSPEAARSQATPRLLAANRAGFITEQEVFADEEFLADPLMTEWGMPNNMHHAAATALHIPTGSCVIVHIQRRKGQPPFAPDDLRLLDAFCPHLARAGLLVARWRLERLRAAAEALAAISLPAAILDANGKVLAANALVEAMKPHIVWLSNDRIALSDRGADALLRQSLAGINAPAEASVRSFPARDALAEGPVVLHLVPLTGEARELFGGGLGILVVTAVSSPAAPAGALIQALFDLSPAEARVARGIAEGLTLDQIAVQQGLSSETIRSQVKRVFAKTAVNRQSQLAVLLASVPTIPMG